MSDLKLHLGCGANIKQGWVNVDYLGAPGVDVIADLTKPFTWCTEKVSHIFTEHMIEHIAPKQQDEFLRCCFNVLGQGGKIRISCPDINFIIDRMRDGTLHTYGWAISRGHKTPLEAFNDAIYEYVGDGTQGLHRGMLNFPEVKRRMEAIGFTNLVRLNVSTVADPGFVGMDTRPDDQSSLVVEATK